MKVLSLFSGIGAFEEALENIGINYELVNYCEFDKKVSEVYSIVRNVSEDKNLGDITKVDEKELEDFDLMTYGFPCQDISMLGDMKGFHNENGNLTRSGLFYEAMRIASHKKPRVMIAENVKALTFKKHEKDFKAMLRLLDELGYNSYYKVLNAKDFNLPQSRNRVFVVSIRKDVDQGFEFPTPVKLEKKAQDYYDQGYVGEQYYIGEKQMEYLNEYRMKKKYSSLNAEVINCQTTKQGNLSNPQNFIKDEYGIRVMTPRELFALQGFKKEQAQRCLNKGITKERLGYVTGNSIAVPVLEAIFNNLRKYF